MRDFLSSDDEVQKEHPNTLYNLVANISHEGEPGRLFLVVELDLFSDSEIIFFQL